MEKYLKILVVMLLGSNVGCVEIGYEGPSAGIEDIEVDTSFDSMSDMDFVTLPMNDAEPNSQTGSSTSLSTAESTKKIADKVKIDKNPQGVTCVLNPYAEVNWQKWEQYKANFHTHTTESDGKDSPATTIDQYHDANYDVLAITDHDQTTWPWANHGRNPDTLGMLPVMGNEYSGSHHMNAFFNFSKTRSDMESGIPHVEASGGLCQLNHPGRTSTPSQWARYVEIYASYPSCVMLEVFNGGDRYSSDRQLWDNINDAYFATYGKLVWGSSNDDKHRSSHLYRNFQFMLAPSLKEKDIRHAMETGAFYFANEPGGSGDADVPRIREISVDNTAKAIKVNATNYESILWIGPGTTVVARGARFDFSEYSDQSFVRIVLEGVEGDSYSQPFGFETFPNDLSTLPLEFAESD